MPRFLLVIPAYREGKRLALFAEALCAALMEARFSVEVQVVDDGSPEEDRVAVAGLCGRLHALWPGWRLLHVLPVNVGKGGAVYSGWDDAGDVRWLGFCDADGSVSAAEVVRLMQGIDARGDVRECVIASRRVAEGRTVSRSWLRGLLSVVFAAWSRWCTGLAVDDTQCGCKFIPTEIYRAIRSGLHERRFAFDVELLFRAVQAGATVRQEPVNWIGRPGGSLRLWKDGAAMVAAVWRLRKSR
ncbi:MAG TPA: glycosyltransferase [Rariglobus sp.]|jgi:glycosyltransferase involved in cell wall biosynthesis|nr:glycosyltransferase [Rariglobus sp.]